MGMEVALLCWHPALDPGHHLCIHSALHFWIKIFHHARRYSRYAIYHLYPLFSSYHLYPLLPSYVSTGLRLGELISWICATPIQFVISAKLYESAAKSLMYAHKANVDCLVMLSSSAAYLYSLVSVFVSLAKQQHEGRELRERREERMKS